MNSIEVTNSPPIKDENYEKTASLLKVIAASQTPNDCGEDKHTIVWALYMFSRILYPTRTIYPSLRLVPSGNFFCGFKCHHFLLKKGQNLTRQLEHIDSNLIALLYIYNLSIFQQGKVIKLESLCSSCLMKFWPFF